MIVYIPLSTNYTATTITKWQFKAIISPENTEYTHLIAFVIAIQTARYTWCSLWLIKFSRMNITVSIYLHTLIIIIVTLETNQRDLLSFFYAQSIPSFWCFFNTLTGSHVHTFRVADTNKFAILLLSLSSPFPQTGLVISAPFLEN